jgi:hypothetical protein
MIRKWFGVAALVVTGSSLLSLSSCAHNQHLQGINVSPSTFTYFAPAVSGVQQAPIPLTAFGTYIHPPETKDITSKVTWGSDNGAVAAVDSSGQLTAGVACGVANVSASFFTDGGDKNGNVVVGYMTVTVEGPASQGCPQGTATNVLSVNVTSNPGDGTITSNPAGINCGSICSAAFASSSSVSLTASPVTGHNFTSWSGCPNANGNTCTVTMNGDVTVSAAFD